MGERMWFPVCLFLQHGLPAGSYQHFTEVGGGFVTNAATDRVKAKQLLLTRGLGRSGNISAKARNCVRGEWILEE